MASIYSETENRPCQKEDDRITATIYAQAKAKREARAAISETTPKRAVYQNHLRVAIDALESAAKLNPNEEHALLSIVCEIKAVMFGTPVEYPTDSKQVRMVAAQLLGVMSEQK